MRRCFYSSGPPDLATGKFIVAWALEHTCDVNPGGVKEPIALAVLDVNSDAVELAEEELQEHAQMITLAYDHLTMFANNAFQAEAPEIPGSGAEPRAAQSSTS
jgi:hypothetical protein